MSPFPRPWPWAAAANGVPMCVQMANDKKSEQDAVSVDGNPLALSKSVRKKLLKQKQKVARRTEQKVVENISLMAKILQYIHLIYSKYTSNYYLDLYILNFVVKFTTIFLNLNILLSGM